MKKVHNWLFLLLSLVSVILFSSRNLSAQFASNNNRFIPNFKKVLVIHSYNAELNWVKLLNEGIKECFEDNSMNDIKIEYEYLDAKRFSHPDNIAAVGKLINKKYSQGYDFDIIICCDDYAWNYVNSSPDYPFVGVPVVFCGLNQNYYQLGKFRNPTTGILEVQALEDNFFYILKYHPKTENILFITEPNNPLNQVFFEFFNQKLSRDNPYLSLDVVDDFTIDELVKKMQELPEESIIYIMTYYEDKNNRFFYSDQIMRIIKQVTDVPVYSPMDYYLGNGIVGGLLYSSKIDGYQAAENAIEILKGVNPVDIPVTTTSRYRLVFDKNELDRLGISTKELPAGYELINAKPSFFEEYKSLSIFGMLALFLIALTVYKYRAQNKKIYERNHKLNETREFLTLASEASKIYAFEWDVKTGELTPVYSSFSGELPFENIVLSSIKTFRENIYDEDTNRIFKDLKELFYGEDISKEIEFRCWNRDKQLIFLKAQLKVIKRSENNKVEKISLIISDTTKQHEINEELKESTDKLLEAQKIGKVGFWEIALNDLSMSFTEEGLNLVGFLPEENPVTFKKFLSKIRHEDQEKVCEHLNPTIGLFPESRELVFGIWINKKLRYLHSNIKEVNPKQSEEITNISGTIFDITESKASEDELSRREKWFKAIFDSSPLGLVLINSKGELTTFNQKFRKIFRIRQTINTLEHRKNENQYEIFPEDKKLLENILYGFKRPLSFEKMLKRSDNSSFWAEIILSGGFFDEKDEPYAIAMISDISERKQIMSSLLSSEKRLRSFFNNHNDGIGVVWYDPNMDKMMLQDCNPAFAKILNYPQDDIIGRSFNIFSKTEQAFLTEYYNKVFTEGNSILVEQFIPATQKWLEGNFFKISNHHVAGIIRDITYKKVAENEIQDYQNRLETTQKKAKIGFYELELLNEKYVVGNVLKEIFGIGEGEFSLRDYLSRVHPDDLIKLKKRYSNALRRRINILKSEYRLNIPGKGEKYVFSEANLKFNEKGKLIGLKGWIQDISELKVAEELKHQTEMRYRSLFENMINGFALHEMVFDEDGRPVDFVYLDVNSVYENISGFKKSQLINKRALRIIPDFKPHFVELFGEIVKTGVPKQFICENENFCKNDKNAFFEVIAYSPGGNQFVTILKDITDKIMAERALSHSEERFRRIFEESPIGICIFDTEGGFLIANKACKELLGLADTSEIKEVDFLGNFPIPTDKMNQLLKGESIRFEVPINFEDVKSRLHINTFNTGISYFDIRINPLTKEAEGKSEFGYLLQIQDVSQRKNVENEILKAKEKAEEADKLKTSFLANVSHSLRTPMNGILGFAEMLKLPSIKNEERLDFSKRISENSRLLLNQINHLIDVSQMEAGRMIIVNNHFNVSEVIFDLQEMFEARKQVDKREIDIRIVVPDKQLTLFSDEVRIDQVLSNLMDNAYKFTQKGYIEVGFEIEKEKVRFFVNDTGSGISDEKKPVIFERFRQADIDVEHRHSGSGLGLYISASLVELLGGEIGYESELNKGSLFWFTIPISSSKEVRVTSYKEESDIFYEVKGKKALIVDTNETSNRITKKILDQYGIAGTFKEISQVLKSDLKDCTSVDFILLDTLQKEGLYLLDQIKIKFPELKVIAMAMDASFSDKQEAFMHGANEFIPKPLVDESFLLKLTKLLS